MISAPIALSVSDEEVRMGTCDCGGDWRLRSEHLVPVGGRWFDSLVTRCQRCGRREGFLFDVTPFFEAHPRIWSGYGAER